MLDVSLELQRLKHTLEAKGFSDDLIAKILSKAEREINLALREQMDNAMELAVQSGVQKKSPEFINDLRPRPDAFELTTASNITDFSDPPYPMLDRLLASGAKPMADGSGVYKIIPVGGTSGQSRPPIHTNIFDAQKAIMAERYESATKQYNKVLPKGSQFRTATSKQSRTTQWVRPATDKDFSEDIRSINSDLADSHDSIIRDVIKSFEEGY